MPHPSAALYTLIQRLTNAESRHFTRLAHLHRATAPHYHCYFVSLKNMPEWSPELEAEAIKDAPYLENLAVLKRQLFEKILYSLDDLHRADDPEERIKAYLHEAYLLLKKGLPKAAGKRLRKARKLLEEHGHYQLWPAWQRTEMLLNEQRIRSGSYVKDQQALEEEWPAQDNEMAIQRTVLHQKLQAYADRFRDLSATESQPDDIEVIALAHPLIQADQLQVAALRAFSSRDPAAASQHNEALLETLYGVDARNKTVPERILSTTYNLLLDYLHLAAYDKLNEGVAELRRLPRRPAFKKMRQLKSRVFEWGFQLELNALARQGQWLVGIERLPALQKGLADHVKTLSAPAFASLHHLGGLMAFHAGQLSLALELLQPLYQEIRPGVAKDIYRYARYLHLLCHYRLDNYDTADSLLAGLQRNPEHAKESDVLPWVARLLRYPQNEKAILREWKTAFSTDSAAERYLYLSQWISQQAAA